MRQWDVSCSEPMQAITQPALRLIEQINKPIGLEFENNSEYANCLSIRSANGSISQHEIFVSEFLCEMIFEQFQPWYLRWWINRRYSSWSPGMRDKLLAMSLAQLWCRPKVDLRLQKQVVCCRLIKYLRTEQRLIMDGFIHFRLKDLTMLWQDAVQQSARDLQVENEYERFISLLQQYVEIQPNRSEEVHLWLWNDQPAQILDRIGNPIDIDDIQDDMLYDELIQEDDRLLNTLMLLAPKRIVIHQQDEKSTICRTIEGIFHGRVELYSI